MTAIAETSARRGALTIGSAKLWFLVVGLAQNAILPWAIGQGGFGAYKRALAFVNVLNNVVVVASIQAVSRAIAAAPPERRVGVLRDALGVHALLGALLGAFFFAVTPLIVAHQHAPHLAPLLRVLALVLVAYGVYAPLVGALNGARSFGAQAALDAGYSTLRTALTAGLGLLFVRRAMDGALGATWGFFATAAAILPIAFFVAPLRGARHAGARLDRRAHLAFFGGLLAAQLFQALMLQIDLVLLGRLSTLHALRAGADASSAQASADRLAGLYAQAQAFGMVPYQLLLAGAYVLFPSIAAARARKDEGSLRQGVERGTRATLIVTCALVAPLAGAPLSILRFAFGRAVGEGALPLEGAAPILRNLALAHGGTAVAMIGVTLFAAAGWARTSASIAALVALLAIVGCAIGGELVGASDAGGVGLGVALSAGLAVGVIVAAIVVSFLVRRRFGAFARAATIARVVFALGLAILVGHFTPTPSARLLCALPPFAPLLVYLATVALLGEPLRSLLTGRARGG